MKNRAFKLRYILLAVLVILVLTPFVWWLLKPAKALDVVVVNKTFPILQDSKDKPQLDYSKQRGLYWVLNHKRIDNPKTGKAYSMDTDYSGNALSNGKLVHKPLQINNVPDMIYLLDAYGTGGSRESGVEEPGISGLTRDEIAWVSNSYARGTTLLGEYNIAGEPTSDAVSKELGRLFGVSFTGMAGKFFSDLSSEIDVPDWIRNIYQKQYGKAWSLSGAGIVIAGNDQIVILQRDIGFTGSSLQVGMNEDLNGKYETEAVNYYNWFEIVEPDAPEDVIAWYSLDLTEEGKKQLEPYGLKGTFPAIVDRREGEQRSVYMAGDFSDYRGPDKLHGFIGAAPLYKLFSIESEGDLGYFYWRFYVPFITNVMEEIEAQEEPQSFVVKADEASGVKLVSAIEEGQFSVYRNGVWEKRHIQGVNVGSGIPGYAPGTFPEDAAFYTEWFQQMADMNANTLRVKDLMPPVFYRALDNFNVSHPDQTLYLIQNISLASDPAPQDVLSKEEQGAFQQIMENTVHALHGNHESSGSNETERYSNDVSGYVLAYTLEPAWSKSSVAAANTAHAGYTYEGDFMYSTDGATPVEAWLASMLDKLAGVELQQYGMQHPLAVVLNPELDPVYVRKAGLTSTPDGQVELDHIGTTAQFKAQLFGAYNIYPSKLEEDGKADFFAGYLNDLVKEEDRYHILVNEFGIPTTNGITEEDQGRELADMIQSIQDSGALGGLVYEWADEWGSSSPDTAPYMIPKKRGALWHNTDDPAQNYGIVAMESDRNVPLTLNLKGSGPLDSIGMGADESYFHIQAQFKQLPDWDKQQLMMYIDTFDRKKGEYMLEPNVNENWSGTEFKLVIPQPDQAELLVIPTYNKSRGTYFTKVTTDGIFERLSPLPDQGASARAKDLSVLTAGSFERGDTHLNLQENTLKVRIPWARLNFTDPSSLLVISDEQQQGVPGSDEAISVKMTDGMVVSLVVMDKQTRKVEYQFPESVTSQGYRTFTWKTWDVPQYTARSKSSYEWIREAYQDEFSP
ncbi:hypothetical protein JJQ72_11475 [Paenibacillus sp. F411]|uniref:hypothetical protein n=1 Tax=Paenibacillus sp. F411 TaxID=2820239 RepID=UPI001AAE713B|nr:hypothetical protein [Paenibacillus sp. F411]MBO2944590.1 hypothetical protein [Paenibacillus sp. F411]